MFNKNNLKAKYFNDNEYPTDYTEEIPLDTGHEWDEKAEKWILKEELEAEKE